MSGIGCQWCAHALPESFELPGTCPNCGENLKSIEKMTVAEYVDKAASKGFRVMLVHESVLHRVSEMENFVKFLYSMSGTHPAPPNIEKMIFDNWKERNGLG